MALKQTNVKGFVKNTKSGVVLNNDTNQLIKFQQERDKIEQFNHIKAELAELKKDFEEFKQKVLK